MIAYLTPPYLTAIAFVYLFSPTRVWSTASSATGSASGS